MEKLVLSRAEAIEKGFLEDKIVYLKPSPRQGKMIKSPVHVGYFMYEGALINFVLPKDSRGELINVFTSREEQDYFEQELGVDLSPYKKTNNFWNTFRVKFQKNPITMYEGTKFDLANPMDNLRVKVLSHCIDVAPNWEQRFEYPTYKFALVQEDYEENKASEEAKMNQEIWKHFGSISNNSTKMREFVGIYLASHRKIKTVPSDASKEWLMKELSDIIAESPTGYLDMTKDPHFSMKAFILSAVSVGAIEKSGVNKYVIPGETIAWGLNELVEYLEQLRENSDDVYLKIKAQISMKSKK
ncbi:MAG: hypothetical protein DRQ35_05985 [Gammaproteobacteria bacterium]|nr:MAG: hypothetical protein DRQ35_05985 [Gammaproteobacteria bacterium]